MARMTEQAHKFDDMFGYTKDLIKAKQCDFTVEERNTLAVSFKNLIQSDRHAVKQIQEISEFDKFQCFNQVLMTFKKKIQSSLIAKCHNVARICEHECLPLAENSESKVFFLKLMADYNRYAGESYAQSSNEIKMKELNERGQTFYQKGIQIACEDLEPCNPHRLSIILNYSIYLREIKQNLVKAILLTQTALQSAMEQIDDSIVKRQN